MARGPERSGGKHPGFATEFCSKANASNGAAVGHFPLIFATDICNAPSPMFSGEGAAQSQFV
jgi:hypothetical protein